MHVNITFFVQVHSSSLFSEKYKIRVKFQNALKGKISNYSNLDTFNTECHEHTVPLSNTFEIGTIPKQVHLT